MAENEFLFVATLLFAQVDGSYLDYYYLILVFNPSNIH